MMNEQEEKEFIEKEFNSLKKEIREIIERRVLSKSDPEKIISMVYGIVPFALFEVIESVLRTNFDLFDKASISHSRSFPYIDDLLAYISDLEEQVKCFIKEKGLDK